MTVQKAIVEGGIRAVIMPPGEYWVGDPCYAVPDARWDEWLDVAGVNAVPFPRFLFGELDSYPVLGIGTVYGDGEYHDDRNRSYPVDAGLIGLTPFKIARADVFGSHRMVFGNAFRCEYQDGVIVLGHIRIDTN